MTPLLVPMPGSTTLAQSVAMGLGAEVADMTFRQFPDGESYVRFLTSPAGRDIIIIASLDRPDPKLSQLFFTADGARDLGAAHIGLVAPYLPYMRQDKRFNPGEVITSITFAKQISTVFDWLITIDPHLHRRASLDEIYTIPTTVLHADSALADWIKTNISNPLLIGPDSESKQWVSEVARHIGCQYLVLSKIRRGDRDVTIDVPDLSAWTSATPVIVDDTISSAHTMIDAVKNIREQDIAVPICCAVHGLYDDRALNELKHAGPAQIVTTNTVPCETAHIDISDLIIAALQRQSA